MCADLGDVIKYVKSISSCKCALTLGILINNMNQSHVAGVRGPWGPGRADNADSQAPRHHLHARRRASHAGGPAHGTPPPSLAPLRSVQPLATALAPPHPVHPLATTPTPTAFSSPTTLSSGPSNHSNPTTFSSAPSNQFYVRHRAVQGV